MYYGFDPMYIVLTIVLSLVSWIVQRSLTSAFNKYAAVPNSRGLTGAQTARIILDQNGLSNVGVKMVAGRLTDHYNPLDRTVYLSESNYNERGIASLSVAAHECGHAIQHKESYSMLMLRQTMFPLVSFSSKLAPFFILIGLSLAYAGTGGLGTMAFLAGIIFFSVTVLFQIVTLPVEFDASKRALNILETQQLLNLGEVDGAKKVLNAAAMTYVAAALGAMAQLAYFILRFLSSSRR